jgi:two-component system, OmpR family, response regulator ChvI
LTKKRPVILVIDDDETLLNTLHDSLVAEGFRVIKATNAITAIILLARRNPDLALLDIMMPKYDGFQTLEMIRLHSSIPVIMLTCLGDQASLQKSLDSGKADGYITKPFSIKLLVAQIKAKLRRIDISPADSLISTHSPGARWND